VQSQFGSWRTPVAKGVFNCAQYIISFRYQQSFFLHIFAAACGAWLAEQADSLYESACVVVSLP
jgi:hypothetical protein